MNERYNNETPMGKTRKSAASAKPKAKAASSVHIQSAEKTPQQKKAARKAKEKQDREKRRALNRKYYNPPTKRYKTLRRIWWVVLVSAIVCTGLSFVLRSVEPVEISYVVLGLAYACIIGAFYLDFSPIRKERERYQDEMVAKETKAARAAEKKAKAEARAQKAEGAEKGDAAKTDEAEKAAKPRLFGLLPAKKTVPAEGEKATEDKAAKESK